MANVPTQCTIRSMCYAWVLCALLLSGVLTRAQQDTGGILIAVTDSSGATVSNAPVLVINNGTQAQLSGVTNDIGTWTATPLLPGDYQVKVSRPGYQTAVVQHVIVVLQQNTRVAFSLRVGNVQESVVVSAEEPPLLQTEDVSAGQTISGVLQAELPVSDRDFNRLAVLTVGVNYSTPSGPRDSVSGAFSANGISQYQNNYILDGTDMPSISYSANPARHNRTKTPWCRHC